MSHTIAVTKTLGILLQVPTCDVKVRQFTVQLTSGPPPLASRVKVCLHNGADSLAEGREWHQAQSDRVHLFSNCICILRKRRWEVGWSNELSHTCPCSLHMARRCSMEMRPSEFGWHSSNTGLSCVSSSVSICSVASWSPVLVNSSTSVRKDSCRFIWWTSATSTLLSLA